MRILELKKILRNLRFNKKYTKNKNFNYLKKFLTLENE